MNQISGIRLVRLVSLVLSAGVLAGAARAEAAPAPPPGGHNPIFYGGDNTPGYPPLVPSGVADRPGNPLSNRLRATSSPNPFQFSTTLKFSLRPEEKGHVQIYSSAGRLVRGFLLPAGPAGQREVGWDGRDEESQPLPSGIYFYRIEAGTQSTVGRLALIR